MGVILYILEACSSLSTHTGVTLTWFNGHCLVCSASAVAPGALHRNKERDDQELYLQVVFIHVYCLIQPKIKTGLSSLLSSSHRVIPHDVHLYPPTLCLKHEHVTAAR